MITLKKEYSSFVTAKVMSCSIADAEISTPSHDTAELQMSAMEGERSDATRATKSLGWGFRSAHYRTFANKNANIFLHSTL